MGHGRPRMTVRALKGECGLWGRARLVFTGAAPLCAVLQRSCYQQTVVIARLEVVSDFGVALTLHLVVQRHNRCAHTLHEGVQHRGAGRALTWSEPAARDLRHPSSSASRSS